MSPHDRYPASSSRNAPPHFDRIARLYRWAEYAALGPLLLRVRRHFLPQLTHVRRALVLGDGDGRFLASLFRQNPALRATAVDISAAMLALLRQRCRNAHATHSPALETLHASALQVPVAAGTDLVGMHFFLDCFSQADAQEITRHLAAGCAPGTLWLVSEFGVPRGRLAGTLARLYIRALYFGFRLLTGLRTTQLPDVALIVRGAGLTRLQRREWLRGFLYSEVWQVNSSLEDQCMTPDQPPHVQDALPDPEPPVPSLGAPDPAVFHPQAATTPDDNATEDTGTA